MDEKSPIIPLSEAGISPRLNRSQPANPAHLTNGTAKGEKNLVSSRTPKIAQLGASSQTVTKYPAHRNQPTRAEKLASQSRASWKEIMQDVPQPQKLHLEREVKIFIQVSIQKHQSITKETNRLQRPR